MGQNLEKIKATCLSCSYSLFSADIDLKTLQPIEKEYSSPSEETDEIIVFESPFHKSDSTSLPLSFLNNINNSKDSDASTSFISTQERVIHYNQKMVKVRNYSLGLESDINSQRQGLKTSRHKSRSSNFSSISINLVESVRVNNI